MTFNQHLKNQRGYTLIQIVVILTIIIALTGASLPYIFKVYQERDKNEITTTIAKLEIAMSSHYHVNNHHAVLTAITLSEQSYGPARKFREEMIKDSASDNIGLTTEQVDNRFKFIDYEKLIIGGYLTSEPVNPEHYGYDVKASKVIHFPNVDSIDDFQQTKRMLLALTGDYAELTTVGKTSITGMMEITDMVVVGNYVVVGGTGTQPLNKATLSEDDEGLMFSDVENLSDKLEVDNNSIVKVSELQHLGNNRILVHYSYEGNTKFKIIDVS